MNFGNMAGLMQKAAKLQKSMKEVEQKIAATEFTGESGGGLVKVTIMGNLTIKQIDMDDSLVKPEEKAMMSDLIAAAFNNAKTSAEEEKAKELKALAGGMPLPPGLGF